MKKLISLFLAVSMLLLLLPAVSAEDEETTGKCGDSLTWELKDGILTVRGMGDMWDYAKISPWETHAIQRVEIAEGVTGIGAYAFADCSLTSVSIPESVKKIGNCAFYYDKGLTAVEIGKNVIHIGDYAFVGCGLTDVRIPANVQDIGRGALAECFSLKSIRVEESNPQYTAVDGVLFDKTQKNLLICPAGKEDASYTVPNGVTTIGESAFADCRNLTAVTISDGVTDIGIGAFEHCGKLTSVVLPSSVTAIGGGAFCYSGLTSIVIPDSVTNLGGALFSECHNLTSVVLPKGMTSIGERTFETCESLESVTLPDGVTAIGDRSFARCSKLTAVNIPNGVTKMGDFAFAFCYELASVDIPDGVTSIGKAAFSHCESMTAITVPASVTSIGDGAFGGRWYENAAFEKFGKFILYGVPGSAAEQYAKKTGVAFRNASITPTMGDLNGDGLVDTTDARLTLQATVGKLELDVGQVELTDVNGDYKIDTTDARLILQMAVGKIAEFSKK